MAPSSVCLQPRAKVCGARFPSYFKMVSLTNLGHSFLDTASMEAIIGPVRPLAIATHIVASGLMWAFASS